MTVILNLGTKQAFFGSALNVVSQFSSVLDGINALGNAHLR